MKKWTTGQEMLFQKAMIDEYRREGMKIFRIETEETEPGFPDALIYRLDAPSTLLEFKVANPADVVHFQKSQPLFYAKNKTCRILIVAYSVATDAIKCCRPIVVGNRTSVQFREFSNFEDSPLDWVRECRICREAL
jgi:hypothetical protein